MAQQPPPRMPPRFVPTLTEVVQVPDTPAHAPAQGRWATAERPAVPSATGIPAAAPPARAAAIPAAAPAPAPVVRPPLPSALPPAVMMPRPPASASFSGAPLRPAAAMSPVRAPVAPAAPILAALPADMEETMVHRVMQRVDVVLELRLREAIAAVVLEQTRSVLPRLREEIESVVRNAVYEAVADELASGAPATPAQPRR